MKIIFSVLAILAGALMMVIIWLYVMMPPMPAPKKTGSKYRIDSDGCL